jgi:hypothetical protein
MWDPSYSRFVRAMKSIPRMSRGLPRGFARRVAWSAAFALAASLVGVPAMAAGTWQAAPSSPTNGGPAFGLWLLTDGTVLSHGNALNHWVILTPDSSGSYANGTWKTVASSAFERGGAQEHVLKDGRFFEAGGEFLYAWPAHDGVAACSSDCTNPASGSPLFKNVEIYDPVANTWTVEADALYDLGDTGSATLSDGTILDSTRPNNAIQIYNPATNTWTAGTSETNQSGDESAWASLQNGGVLAVQQLQTSIYNPATATWIATGPLPSAFKVTLTAASGYPGTYGFGDTAGISQMFDGRVLAYGLGTTVIYTPGASASDPGTWALGPDMPYQSGSPPIDGTPGNECEDEYTVTEPNGKVMVATHQFGGPIDALQEFDPTTNTMALIDPPPDPAGGYPVSYLNLPNGQVMTTGGSLDWLYTPDSLPQDAWRPTVTSVVFNSGTTYTLTGTQLSGLINGGDEGDDMTMAENYPIVWLTDNANHVYYCKSFNFSNMMPSKGSTPETCQFTTPAGLAAGSYNLFVSAVGVQSKVAFPFTTGTSTTLDGGSGGSGGSGGTAGAGGAGGAAGAGGSGGTGGTAGAGGAGGSGGVADAGGAGGSGGIAGAGGSGGSGGVADAGGAGGSGGIAGAGGSGGSGGVADAGSSGGAGGTTGAGGAGGSAGGPGSDGGGNGANIWNPSGCGGTTVGNSSGREGYATLFGLLGLVARRRRSRR